MDHNSREFALFIDGIRLERGISREDLIEGIISLSQYKRYLRGAAAIPNNVVVQIADRLRYSINDFYSLFTKKHNSEYNQLISIFKLIQSEQYQKALEACYDIKDELIVSSYNKIFYDYCFLYSQYMLGKISAVHTLGIFSDIIDYPVGMEKETFNMVEINILLQIVRISASMGNYEAADFLYTILTNPNLSSNYTGEVTILPIIYYYTARVFRQQDKLRETLELANSGIQAAITYETTNSLPHLYLLASLVQKEMNNELEALACIKKCFLQLIVIDKPVLTESFKSVYQNNFDTPIEELLKDVHKMI